jgi:hypothetical protein
MNWNEELMSSVRPGIDHAFRSLLDKSVDSFKAEAAQAIKEALRDLNHVLKSKSFIHLYIIHRLWRAMHTSSAFLTI